MSLRADLGPCLAWDRREVNVLIGSMLSRAQREGVWFRCSTLLNPQLVASKSHARPRAVGWDFSSPVLANRLLEELRKRSSRNTGRGRRNEKVCRLAQAYIPREQEAEPVAAAVASLRGFLLGKERRATERTRLRGCA
jgi:hypothetical protein